MNIFLIINNKKFKVENNYKNKKLQVEFMIEKVPSEYKINNLKEFYLVNDEEIFKINDYIDFEKHQNKEFYYIEKKTNSSSINKINKIEEDKINKNNIIQLIQKVTNAQESLKPKFKPIGNIKLPNQGYFEYYEDFDYSGSELNISENGAIIVEEENDWSESENSSFSNNNEFQVNEGHLSQLVSMGFSIDLSIYALKTSRNNLHFALEILMFNG